MSPDPRGRSLPSIRRQLQTSTVLAVLVGYLFLLGFNQFITNTERRQRHRQAIAQVAQTLLELPSATSLAGFQNALERTVSPGRLLWIELERGRPYRPPVGSLQVSSDATATEALTVALLRAGSDDQILEFGLDGQSFLSGSRVLELGSRSVRLHMLENVTPDMQQAQTVQLLLLAMAGVSALITSTLVRLLVLRRGLRPLDRIGAELAAIDPASLVERRLETNGQRQELLPIAMSVNGLLDRLALDRSRQQAFVDGVAHELRTPITLISGYAESLSRRPGNGDREAAERIRREAERMSRLVSDLLDLAREEAGRLQLLCSTIDADDALLEAFERLQELAAGRLRLHPPPVGALRSCNGDPQRLQQCLTNLVENALKYTPTHCPIELFATTTVGAVILHVRDHGPGVTDEQKEWIFEPFMRGSAEASGSGIGLALVRLLMQRMGGTVRVEDAPGGGADFQLILRSFSSPPPA